MTYKEACEARQQAENRCIAELFRECCDGDPHVPDENGTWLTKEQVYEKLRKGDKK